MDRDETARTTYTRYPISSLLIYNGVTLLHFFLGAVGIAVGYNLSPIARFVAYVYLAFALLQMYVLMPLTVCPNCVYRQIEKSRCISGLNLLSNRITRPGDLNNFAKRGQGLFCHNNLYMASLILPLLAMLPALIFNLSLPLTLIFLSVLGLLVYRVFVIFPRIACVHCSARKLCPNAQAMGLDD